MGFFFLQRVQFNFTIGQNKKRAIICVKNSMEVVYDHRSSVIIKMADFFIIFSKH